MGKLKMKCPCCKHEMPLLVDHEVETYQSARFDGRQYKVYLCRMGGQFCSGLIIKHDIYDDKLTFITPCHTTTTLHSNYIKSVSEDDLIRSIFTVFEWEGYLNHKKFLSDT